MKNKTKKKRNFWKDFQLKKGQFLDRRYAVELKIGPRFGGFCVKASPRVVLKTGPSFFFFTVFPSFVVFLACLKNTNSVNLCQNSVFTKLSGCQK